MKNGFTVSICMITYNHESYIKQAIDGVLMQKTNFDFELVIGEDCSTDSTRLICKEYANRETQIRILPSESNLGIMSNFIKTLQACTGKYIALCEGDDYWTDPFKLQKQVDILENNIDFVLCFHEAKKYFIDSGQYLDFKIPKVKNEFTTCDLILRPWFVPTASIVFRRKYLPEYFPSWFLESSVGDIALLLFLSKYGKLICLREKMSVYQIGAPDGVFLKLRKNPVVYMNNFNSLLENVNKQHLEGNYLKEVRIRKLRTFLSKLKYYIFTKWLKK